MNIEEIYSHLEQSLGLLFIAKNNWKNALKFTKLFTRTLVTRWCGIMGFYGLYNMVLIKS